MTKNHNLIPNTYLEDTMEVDTFMRLQRHTKRGTPSPERRYVDQELEDSWEWMYEDDQNNILD